MSDLVCVTGASGYVGSYVVKELLARGHRVRAAVRDPDKKKLAHLVSLDRADELLELVHGDLERPGSFDAATKGADALIHTASAVVLSAKDPQREIVDVAVDGTRNVIGAALASGSVRRIVLTSSIAAVTDESRPRATVFDEADWNDGANVKNDAYATSKVKSERAARDMVNGSNARLTALLPSLVLGPVMTAQHLRTSTAILHELMKGKWPAVPDLHFQVIDVRDLAVAHVNAMEVDAPHERYLCSTDAMGLRFMADELRIAFPQAKVPRPPLPDLLMYASAIFEPRLTFSFLKRNLGRSPRVDNRRLREELGVPLRSVRDTVIDTGRSIVEGGYL